ncbi:MAG TPA: glycosyltransferase family 39 protein [Bacteroidia bacterium]|jgi:hypothetical protein|nr:glycosyltransferase family 39 protein [Bacteroidia bacterium]
MPLPERFQKPFFRDCLFYALLAIGMIICGWPSFLAEPQSEPHLWRQSDCLSFTDYYAKGNGFFEPEMYNRVSDDITTGKTITEFPIVYYIIGKLWAVFGKHIWIFRLFSMLLSIIAMILLYRTVLKISGLWFWSAMAPLLLLASPIYTFYGMGFLSNIHGFNCAIIAWYFFCRYYESRSVRMLLYSMLFFSLAGLLKASSLLSYFMLMGVAVLDLTRRVQFREGGLFDRKIKVIGILLLPVFFFLLWYKGFVAHYIGIHHGQPDIADPLPIWTNTAAERGTIWRGFIEITYQQVYPPFLWMFFFATMTFLLIGAKKLNRIWLFALPLLLLGSIAFDLLFFVAMNGHDYYQIDMLILFVFIYAALVHYLSKHHQPIHSSRMVKGFFSVFVLYALMGAASNLQIRLHGCPGSELAYRQIFSTKKEIETLDCYANGMRPLFKYVEIGNELRKRGYGNDVPVISINDQTFNATLFMMEHPGYTDVSDWFADSMYTAVRIQHGARILTVEFPENETRSFKAFMGYPLFRLKDVGVYDLQPYVSQLQGK